MREVDEIRNLGELDYYPFGMGMPARSFAAGAGYKFGFNGKESDAETYGNGNIYDYGFRIYNPRLGKFLSVDPLLSLYPMFSSYQFASNSPILFIDIDGLEAGLKPDNSGKESLNKVTGDQILEKFNDDVKYVKENLPKSYYDDRCMECDAFDWDRYYDTKTVYSGTKWVHRINYYTNDEANAATESWKEAGDNIETAEGIGIGILTDVLLNEVGITGKPALLISAFVGFASSKYLSQHDIYFGRGYSMYEKVSFDIKLSSKNPENNTLVIHYTLEVYDNNGNLVDTVTSSETVNIGDDDAAQALIKLLIDSDKIEYEENYSDTQED